MPTGIIKWFNNTKGWGFITPTDGKEEIFVHFSAVLNEGYKTLFSGQHVNYSIKTRPKGEYAADLTPAERIKKEKKK